MYSTEEELIFKANDAKGKTFSEIDIHNRLLKNTKGQFGHIIEESLFGYDINSNAKPDFEELDIELKVTPIKINKNKTFSSKERLVLNMINYMNEPYVDFLNSSFWYKNKKLLLMFYLWLPDTQRKDFRIIDSFIYTYPEEDLEIIKNDWKIITNKIKAGKAHELSEGDTFYLGACTKGANSKSLREQPFSKTLAKKRAYSLKQSYMTTLVRQRINGNEMTKFTSSDKLKKNTIEELIELNFSSYYGKTLSNLSKELNIPINKNSKSYIPQFISAMLGIRGTKLTQIEEFAKADIKFKSVRIEANGIPKESMSFKNIDFNKWQDEEQWEKSTLYTSFEKSKLLFIVLEYKESKEANPDRQLYFKKVKLWNMPLEILNNELQNIWIETKKILDDGIDIQYVKRGCLVVEKNNLPKSNFNGVAHIRPKARNAQDKYLLKDGQKITKQCFWLNSKYVAEILK
ncbi:MAG: Sau3AI family type II restriction endonuclease [Carnobacterium sp.]|uniref:Sau3AI family type II restriction endonuclease n=1 Tax=Carnobacterium sp. TaxID=48221 RepID=UPI003C711F42